MFCKNCGNQLPEGANYCPVCSAKVNGNENPEKEKKLSTAAVAAIAAASAVLIVAIIIAVVLGASKKNDSEEITTDLTESSSYSSEEETSITEKTTSTTTTTTTTTTTKATEPAIRKQDVIDAYKKRIRNETTMTEYSQYYIYDIDNDGICELINDTGDCEASREYKIYKYVNGEAELLDKVNAFHSTLFVPVSGEGLISSWAHMGSYGIVKYTLKGTNLKTEQLEQGDDMNDPDKYDSVFNRYCKTAVEGSDRTDFSLLNNVMK